MELAMLDVLAEHTHAAGVRTLRGTYIPTKKNSMVADHYRTLGFTQLSADAATGATVWELDLSGYTPRNTHIRILEPISA
jgi:predicted enzyme involved in methoxymalonyl-ACP biosynthesis